jgi:hypothetical protein
MTNRNGSIRPARPRPPGQRNYSYRDHVLTLESLLNRFDELSPRDYGQWTALCPVHADTNPSLSISINEEGRVLIHCHAGCSFDKICEAVGSTRAEVNGMRVTDDELGEAEGSATSGAPQMRASAQGSRPAFTPDPRWAAQADEFAAAVSDAMCEELAEALHVAPEALRYLGIGWNAEQRCWTFPERDGCDRVIGISTRYPDGHKGFLNGGHRGLYYPAGWQPSSGWLLIVEGATDTAAGLTHGLNAVGRPSCRGGVKHLIELLHDSPADCNIVVVGEMDAKSDGSWPGKDGAVDVANQLASQLARPVSWMLPPDSHKDLRAWLHHERTSSVFPEVVDDEPSDDELDAFQPEEIA